MLLSLRDDFLIHCHAHEALRPILSELTLLGPPSGAALRRAVVQPALKCGYRFEDEALVDQMLGEVEGERGALPLVAFAAEQLWQRRDREQGVLSREAYELIGGVGGALAQHAELTLERIGTDRVPVVRELFRNLVTAQGTRAVREREELLSVFKAEGRGADRKAAAEVLDALIDARMLTSYGVEAAEDSEEAQQRIEIVHESLLSAWPRLVRWQAQDVEGARMRDDLRQAARRWQERDRPRDLLWTGSAFREFQLWRERYPGGLSEIELAFADATVAHAQRRRRRRRLAAALGASALLAVAVVTTSLWQWSNDARQRAEAEARRAEASKLLALAQARREGDPTEALAYTTASLELADTEAARVFAIRLLWEAPPALELKGNDNGLRFPFFSADGSRLAAAGHTGKARVWTAEGGPPLVLPGHGEEAVIPLRARLASDELLVTGLTSVALQAHVWRLPEGERVRTIDFGSPAWWEVGGTHLRAQVRETDADSGHQILHLRAWRLPDGEAEELGTVDRTELGSSISGFDFDGSGWFYGKGHEVFYRPLPAREGVPDRLVGRHDNKAMWAGAPTEPDRLWTRDASTGELRLWDLSASAGEPLQVLSRPTGLEGGAVNVYPDPSGRWAGSLMREAGLWSQEAWPEARPLTLRRSGSWFGARATFHPRGDWLVVSMHGYTRLTFWPLRGAWPSVVDGYSTPYFRPLEFSRDGRWLATVWPDNSLRLWPLPGSGTRQVTRLPLPPPDGKLWRDLALDPQGRFLFAVSHDGGAGVVPLDGSPPRRLESFDNLLHAAAVSPSGRQVATAFLLGKKGTGHRTLRVWNLETSELRLFDLPESSLPESSLPDLPSDQAGGVVALAFADELTLYTAGAFTGGVHRWNLDTGTHELVLPTTPGFARMWAAFGPGARTALVIEPMPGGEYVGPARILDLASGEVREFSALAKTGLRSPTTLWPINAFDISGTAAAMGDREGIVRVARLSGGEAHLLLGHEGAVDSVAISPDGRWIASSGEDNTLRLWPMPDLSKPPLHTLPHDELIAKLRSLTNFRTVRDPEAPQGWRIELDPFPGWAEVPSW